MNADQMRELSLRYARGSGPSVPVTGKKKRAIEQRLSPTVSNMQRMAPVAFERKGLLKTNPTPAEAKFRQLLLDLRISFQFQRLVFTERRYFILDFVTYTKPKIIFELDGSVHDGREAYDAERTRLIGLTESMRKWKVVRIKNEQVYNGQAVEILRGLYPRQFKRWWPSKTAFDQLLGL